MKGRGTHEETIIMLSIKGSICYVANKTDKHNQPRQLLVNWGWSSPDKNKISHEALWSSLMYNVCSGVRPHIVLHMCMCSIGCIHGYSALVHRKCVVR